MRQFVYTNFISNNRELFHLWWKENLVNHQKVSKYYENDCRICLHKFLKFLRYFLISYDPKSYVGRQLVNSFFVQAIKFCFTCGESNLY